MAAECPHDRIEDYAAPGRTLHDGTPIPADMVVTGCRACGEWFLTRQNAAALDALRGTPMDADTRKTLESLAETYEVHARVIETEDPERSAVPTTSTARSVREKREDAAAIRAAIAEVDRLTKERDDYATRLSALPSLDEATAFATVASALAAVVRPDTDYDYRHAQAKRGMDALQSAKVHAARRNAEVADLRARAIPKAWVDQLSTKGAMLILHHESKGDVDGVSLHVDGKWLAVVCREREDADGERQTKTIDTKHATLADALAAAAKETT